MKFKVGDLIVSKKYGDGRVFSTDPLRGFVLVAYGDLVVPYSLDGKELCDDVIKNPKRSAKWKSNLAV